MILTALIGGLTLGVLGSLHCAGMCGPLVAACAGVVPKSQTEGVSRPLIPSIYAYQLGRIAMYVVLGGLFGLFGTSIQLFGGQLWAALTGGILLIVFGLFGKTIERHIVTTSWLSKGFSLITTHGGTSAPYLFGAMNGLLPCGLIYTALAASLALGSLDAGMLFMLGFGVATSPALVASAWMSRHLRGLSAKLFPVLSVVAGLVLIWRAVAADLPPDWINYFAMHPQMECH